MFSNRSLIYRRRFVGSSQCHGVTSAKAIVVRQQAINIEFLGSTPEEGLVLEIFLPVIPSLQSLCSIIPIPQITKNTCVGFIMKGVTYSRDTIGECTRSRNREEKYLSFVAKKLLHLRGMTIILLMITSQSLLIT